MDYIVYILGAGFSAPLGIPVMSQFLSRSKDLFASGDARFAYFHAIFERIKQLAIVKNTYDSDQHNIEEILSLLEMQHELKLDEKAPTLRGEFLRYLGDVVDACTPAFSTHNENPKNWPRHLYLRESLHFRYAAFVASLHQATVAMTDSPYRLQATYGPRAQRRYAVVTLNYDNVIEALTDHVRGPTGGLQTVTASGDLPADAGLPIAKLHGSIGSVGKDIIPPTWSKGFHPEMLETWGLAFRLLERATHIRVIGYSLPDSDAYVRFLLKSAALTNDRLKSFDVLCLDDSGGTALSRYRSFVCHPSFRFRQESTEKFLSRVEASVNHRVGGGMVHQEFRFDAIEEAHRATFP